MAAANSGARLTGIGVGDQSAWGKAFLLEPRPQAPAPAKSTIGPVAERERLVGAIKLIADELRELAIGTDAVNAEILIALAVLIEDEALLDAADQHLADGFDAQTAVQMAIANFSAMLAGEPMFAERIADLHDLGFRVALQLAGISWSPKLPAVGPIVIVADDLSPAETAQFTSAVVGVVTRLGGPTSHTAIVCRQRGIPAIVGVGESIGQISSGQSILVDAAAGEVVLDAEERTRVDVKAVVVAASSKPIIEVLGNAGSVADAKALNETAASGIGLFRTELLFLNRSSAPTLEEQTQVYAEVLRAAPAGKVVFRTLDVDSDKSLPFLTSASSAVNGQTDLRGWRIHRLAPEILPTQLAAIAAAAKLTNRKVSAMAPMIIDASEANEFATLAKAAGIDDIGVMVETVELAQSIETLTGIVNFISIGTNDLSRYLFGVDRLASESAELLDAWQPKLLTTVANIVAAAKRSAIAVSVCGEAAAEPLFALVLAGLGVDSVSMAGPAIAKATSLLGSVNLDQAREIATAALEGQDRTAARQLASAKLEK